ncbi:CCA tRNA nucleotidyltransferase [Roseospira marina]|uniref:CCA tRNA nucleotidyltransferase n=1 Tax=Roseospira marina TaxID=140057 RepID=A0A5M6IA89_9PROT|nr:CCA tRNA nucleotidyltransferase [Roseospira marina]KAA5604639.1 CCA tRNA nucleotidyltransferase [Roseospira marina]MBB4315081.1 poly(A) polymerase [Roseospira marina]MBB5088149.1 poly(A) polymerase [Roseospira marina]
MTRDWSHLSQRGPVGQLSADPWLTDPALTRLVAALRADGTEVRLVGGCVRDGLLRRPVKDVDLATPDPPETVLALLERADLRTVPWARGVAHGTVLAVVDETPFEVTTLRRDVACDGRHAEVAFTTDWLADAARRDFTINALSATPEGAVYDYFDGMVDLAAGRVRFVGRALDRIREDALRMLRFVRFQAYYGQVGPDTDAMAACHILAHTVRDLSAERVRTELLKILAAPDPAAALLLMRGVGLLDHVLPEAFRFGTLRMLAFLETRGVVAPGVAPDPLRRLGAVVDPAATSAEDLAARLRLSRAESRRLTGILRTSAAEHPRSDLNDADRRRRLDRLGPALFRDLCLLDWAAERDARGHTDSDRSRDWRTLLEAAGACEAPPFPLSGHDLVAAGVPRGPAVGDALAALRDWWLAEGYAPDRAALLAHLSQSLDHGPTPPAS